MLPRADCPTVVTMGCGASVVAFELIDENVKLKDLRKTVKKAKEDLEKGVTVGTEAKEQLAKLEEKLACKEELAEAVKVKTSDEDYITVDPEQESLEQYRDALFQFTDLRERGQTLRVMSPQEKEALDKRITVHEDLTNSRTRMTNALNNPATSQLSIDELRSLVSEDEAALENNVAVNASLENVLTRTKMQKAKALGRRDPRLDHSTKFPEVPQLEAYMQFTITMADHKQEMVDAEADGEHGCDENTSLKITQRAYDRMLTAKEEAPGCHVADAPEMEPLLSRIMQLSPLLATKQELWDAVSATPYGFVHSPPAVLIGSVTQRIQMARDKAIELHVFGEHLPERLELEKQLEVIPQIVQQKYACADAMKVDAHAEMLVSNLDNIASELKNVLEETETAINSAIRQEGPETAPEYARLNQRWLDVVEMSAAKTEMAAATESVLNNDTSTEAAVSLWNRLLEAEARAQVVMESYQEAKLLDAPELEPLQQRMEDIEPSVDAKIELRNAIEWHQEDMGRLSVDALRGVSHCCLATILVPILDSW